VPIYTQEEKRRCHVPRLEKLKDLERDLRDAMCDADPKSLASLARQYRETLREIDELEKDEDDLDEIARILANRQANADAPGRARVD